jgi:hypothetical protein
MKWPRVTYKCVQLDGSRHSERTRPRKQRNNHYGGRYQETSSEHSADWENLACALVICKSVEISDGAIIKCNFKSCFKMISKSNIQFGTPSRATHTRDNVLLILSRD